MSDAARQTGDQPVHETFRDAEHQSDTGQLGMWTFLASEIMLFGGLFLAYTVIRLFYSEGFAEGSRELDLVLGGINTAVLLGSSLFMALADLSARAGKRRALMIQLCLVVALGTVFLGIKFYEYYEKSIHGHVPGSGFHLEVENPQGAELFYFLYFVLTGLHATHMVLGLGFISTLIAYSLWRKKQPAPLVIESTALYWHFVDIVWVFLYPLLYLVR